MTEKHDNNDSNNTTNQIDCNEEKKRDERQEYIGWPQTTLIAHLPERHMFLDTLDTLKRYERTEEIWPAKKQNEKPKSKVVAQDCSLQTIEKSSNSNARTNLGDESQIRFPLEKKRNHKIESNSKRHLSTCVRSPIHDSSVVKEIETKNK